MTQVKLLFIVGLCLLASGCNQQDWVTNLGLWNSQSQNYQYVMRTTTGTIPADVEVNVVNGEVSSAFLLAGDFRFEITGPALLPIPTIQGHFMVILPQLLDESKTFNYDETLGYPTSYTQVIPNINPEQPSVIVTVEILNLQITE